MSQSPESPDAEPLIVHRAAALMIGGELLSGKIRDENFYQLSLMLRSRGITLARGVFCPDDRAVIARYVRELSEEHDVVFTSGGVGPTHDDVTVEAVSQALGVETVVSDEMIQLVRRFSRGEPESTLRLMARVPDGARLVHPPGATEERPGWPLIVVGNIWILPGVPELFRSKLAVVRDALRGPSPFSTARLYCRLSESELKEALDAVVQAHPQVEVGSYPKWFDSRYKTLITFDATSQIAVTAAHRDLRMRLGAEAISTDFD